jgi:hypothetical protein
MVVDLPEPFGPRNPVTTPGETVKLSRSTASVERYRLVRWSTSIMRSTLGSGPVRGNAERLRLRLGVIPHSRSQTRSGQLNASVIPVALQALLVQARPCSE